MATKSDFIVKSGIRVAANATVSGAASISGNLTIAPTAALIVNSSSGTTGQVLTSNGTAVYWANAEAGVNTDARYTWTNTHTFQSVVTFGNTSINSTINSTILSIQSVSANLTGNVAATTLSGNLTGNVIGNVVATTLSGNLTGNVAAVTITGNLTGNVVATSVNATTINATANVVVGANVLINTSTISVGNSTVRTIINTTAFAGNVVATTLSGNLTGNVVATTISGNLTGNVSATTISGNLTAVTANVTDKIQVGIPGAFDFGSNAVIEIDANGNTYVQSVIQNANTGNNASADLVVTNDTGNDSFNYVDLGINGSNYNQPGYNIVGQNDAYLYASDGNLAIGTKSAKEVIFHANGTTATDRRLTVNATAVTIANAAALVANGGPGTGAQILTSNGTGVYWSSSANNADNLGGTAAASYQLNSTLNANIASYLPTYTGVVNASTLQVGTAFKANTTDVVAANLTVQGNLIVTGTTVTLNTATLDVKDLNITVAKGVPSAAAADGAGITVDVANAEIVYVNAGNTWLSNIGFSVGNSTSNVSINSTAFIGNVVGTRVTANLVGNVAATTITGNLTGNVAATTISGNLTGNVAAVTISGNLTGNVAATTISGNLTGNVVATTISGNLTGNVVAGTVNATTINATSSIVVGANVNVNTSTIAIGNATANVFVNSTAFVGNVVATSITGNLTGNVVATTISGNLTGNVVATNINTTSIGITSATIIGNQLTTGTGGTLRLVTAGGWNYIQSGGNTTTGAAAPLIFSDINAGNEWARISATGNVGIGNTTPAHKLSVDGTTNLAGAVTGITTLAAGNTTITGFANVSAGVNSTSYNVGTSVVANTTGTYATFVNGKTEGNLNVNSALYANASITNAFTVGTAAYFVSNGSVGVGTSSPSSKLYVIDTTASNGDPVISLQGADGGSGGGISFRSKLVSNTTVVEAGRISTRAPSTWTNTVSTHDAFMSFQTVLNGALTESFRILSPTQAGFGNFTGLSVSPSYNLEVVANTTDYVTVGLTNYSTSAFGGTQFLLSHPNKANSPFASIVLDANNALVIDNQGDMVNNEIIFSSNYTERARFASNGNLGIGNTTPAHKLRVTGTTSLAGAVSDVTTLAAGNTTITGFINSTSTAQFGGNLTLASTSAIIANSTAGVSGQVLTSNGSAVYWATAAAAGTNAAAQYAWTNTHSFSSMVTFSNGVNQSNTTAAAWFSSGGGVVAFDTNMIKRISWNDGNGNFNIRSGQYYNGTSLIYANDGTSGGAAGITINSDATEGAVYINAYPIGTAGATVSGGSGVYLTPSYFNVITANVGIGNTAPTHKLSVNGTGYFGSTVNVVSTFASGNATITGFANVSTSVNAASYTVGSTVVANTTGTYATFVNGKTEGNLNVNTASTASALTITSIPGSTDLNSYTSTGTYHQNANANAASGTNYPVALAGLLEVYAFSAMIYQRYTVYNTGEIYTRSYYLGTWYAWHLVLDSGNYNSYALPLSGGTMTGSISFAPNSGNGINFNNTDTTMHRIYLDSYYTIFKSHANEGWKFRDNSNSDKVTILAGSGNITTSGNVSASAMFASNWFRSTGQTGWYSETYGGGIYMNDTTQVKTYNNKRFWAGAFAGTTATSTDTSQLQLQNGGGTGDNDVAAISFHCAGYYGMKLHLRADGYFGWGGWSASAWRFYQYLGNGDVTAAGNITAYSDIRLKENITPLENSLDKIKKLNGVRFTWKDLPDIVGAPGKADFGILAHEVEAVAPELISQSPHESPDGDRYKTVAYDKLVPILIEAVKDLSGQVEYLKEELKKLKGE